MSFVYAFQFDNGIEISKYDNPHTKKIPICLLETQNSLFYEGVIHRLLYKYKTNSKKVFSCSHELVVSIFNAINIIINSLNKEDERNNLITNTDNDRFMTPFFL
jgi:hypothetical protein